MVKHYLDFEKPLVELEGEIERLKRLSLDQSIHSESQLRPLEEKLHRLQKDIFSNLNPWQITQLARHIDRPKTSDYVHFMSENFIELHGDRTYGDDPAIIGGLCKFNGRSVILVGHQKGNNAKEMVYRNFGMPHPEGYRKALRLMKMAEVFKRPVVTLIDTPGAYPGVGSRGKGTGGGHRKESDGHGQPSHSDHHCCDRGGWKRRRLGHRRGRPGLDAGVFHLFGHLTRRMCSDSLEGRCQRKMGCRIPAADCRGLVPFGCDRRGREGAPRGMSSRP